MPRVASAPCGGKRAREQVFRRTDPAYFRLGRFESFVEMADSFLGKSQSMPPPPQRYHPVPHFPIRTGSSGRIRNKTKKTFKLIGLN
jgi:hypothetical protein